MNKKRLNSHADKAVDVYAYAITLFEVIMRRGAFFGESGDQIRIKVLMGIRPVIDPAIEDIFNLLYPNFVPIIRKSWDMDPTLRPTFAQIHEILVNDMLSEQQQHQNQLQQQS